VVWLLVLAVVQPIMQEVEAEVAINLADHNITEDLEI
jgi:hypothetical protein